MPLGDQCLVGLAQLSIHDFIQLFCAVLMFLYALDVIKRTCKNDSRHVEKISAVIISEAEAVCTDIAVVTLGTL